MNQSQRNFLIKKIEETIKAKVKMLQDSKPEYPSLNNYLLHAVMSGTFELRPNEEIKKILLQKALNAKGSEDWLGNHWGMANKNLVAFKAEEIFIVPDEYKDRARICREKQSEIEQQINVLRIQSETLITRIQLASDKTLQKMINEVDDMGDISLIDTKLKVLNN